MSVRRRRRTRQMQPQRIEPTEDMLERDYEKPKFEQPVDDINWTAGVGRPAGMYWLDGRIVMAAHDSPAEDRLIGVGAVLVGTLRFDPDPLERVHREGHVQRVPAAHAARLRDPALN